jgi:hypothetical protein
MRIRGLEDNEMEKCHSISFNRKDTKVDMGVCTSRQVGFNTGWKTPFSPGFPTGLADSGLKVQAFSPGSRKIRIILVPIGVTNRDL